MSSQWQLRIPQLVVLGVQVLHELLHVSLPECAHVHGIVAVLRQLLQQSSNGGDGATST